MLVSISDQTAKMFPLTDFGETSPGKHPLYNGHEATSIRPPAIPVRSGVTPNPFLTMQQHYTASSRHFVGRSLQRKLVYALIYHTIFHCPSLECRKLYCDMTIIFMSPSMKLEPKPFSEKPNSQSLKQQHQRNRR